MKHFRFTVAALGALACLQAGGSQAAESPVTGSRFVPLGKSWQQRLQAVGMEPEDLGRIGVTTTSAENDLSIEVRRRYFFAQYLEEFGRAGEAVSELEKAANLDHESLPVLLAQADMLTESGQLDKAQTILNRILGELSDNVDALVLKGQVLATKAESASNPAERSELVNGAVAVYEKARKAQPENQGVLRSLIRLYAFQSNLKKLEQAYRDLMVAAPRDPGPKLILARILTETNRPQEALELYDRVVSVRRGFIPARLEKGALLQRMGRLQDAADAYREAILVDPSNKEARSRWDAVLSKLYSGEGPEKILEQYQRFVAEYPYSLDIRRLYADQLLAVNQVDRAVAEFAKICELDERNVQAHQKLGDLLLQTGRIVQARAAYQRAVEIDPTATDVWIQLSLAFERESNPTSATEALQRAIRLNPESVRAQLALFRLLKASKQTDAADAAMKKLLALPTDRGNTAEVVAQVAQICEEQRDYQLALELYGKALALAPTNATVLAKSVQMALRVKNKGNAEQFVDLARNANIPMAPEDLSMLVAEAYQFEGYSDDAEVWFRKALQANPQKLGILARLVVHLNARKKYDQALAVLAGADPKLAGRDELIRLKAATLLDRKDYPAALGAYKDILSRRPGDFEAIQLYVEALAVAKKTDEALAEVTAAENKFGKTEETQSLRALVMLRLKRYDEAVRILNELTKGEPKRPDEVYLKLASAYSEQKKYSEAQEAFRKAVALNPNNDNALNGLGYLLADQNIQLAEARSLIERALTLNPQGGHIIDSLGWVAYREGKFEEARDLVQKALNIMGEDPEILEHLGDIELALGRKDKAQDAFRRALKLEPGKASLKSKLGGRSDRDSKAR